MHFGKRSDDHDAFDRGFLAFGKRDMMNGFDRDFMHFGKRSSLSNYLDHLGSKQVAEKKDFDREFLHFGRKKRQV